MRRLAALVAAVALMACGSTSPTPPAPEPTGLTAEQWSADLDALVAGIESVHPNPWWREPRADFLARVAALKKTIPAMSHDDAAVALIELVATIDGHSAVYPTDVGFSYYGIRLYDFSDGLHVVAAPGHPEAVGGRLVSVGGVPVEEVRRRLTPLVSHDNGWTVRNSLPLFLVIEETLAAKRVVADRQRPSYAVRTVSGATVTLDPPALGWDEYQRKVGGFPVGLPVRARPMSESRTTTPIWWKDLASGVLYVQYNAVRLGSEGAADAIEAAVAKPGLRRLVIDVRYNGGGDNTTYARLLGAVGDAARKGRVAVLVGRQTFSAAMNFVTDVARRAPRAVFVGEPTGARPSLYGDVGDVLMPRSGFVAHVSTRYHEGGPGETLTPDVRVDVSSAYWLAARDRALDAALAA